MIFSTLTPLTDTYIMSLNLCTVYFSTVGNQEQGKQKIPRKSSSILPMLPHLSSPRKIRSVKTQFQFSSFPAFFLILSWWFVRRFWKNGRWKPPLYFSSPLMFLALSMLVYLYNVIYLNQLRGDYPHIPLSGLDVPASPLGGDLKWSRTQMYVCVLRVLIFTRLYTTCLMNHFFAVHQVTPGFLCGSNVCAEVGIKCVELSPFSPLLQGSAVLSHVSSSLRLHSHAVNAHALLY